MKQRFPARLATRTVVGREARVDVCPADGGLVISVGPMSIWLERRDAEDLVETLELALVVSNPAQAAKLMKNARAEEARRAAAS
jgi:hypothetical protein